MQNTNRAERAEERCRDLQETLESTIKALEDIRDNGEHWRENLPVDIKNARIVAYGYKATH